MRPFNPETGRFDLKEVKITEDIEREYLERYGSDGFVEIKLIRPHRWADKLGYVEDEHYYVYMRKSQNVK